MNTRTKIRQAMRDNERELLAHLRKNVVSHTAFFSMADHNALDRLMKGGKVKFYRGRYVARKGARPVTSAVR